MPKKLKTKERRLFGTWQSDRKRTMAEYKFAKRRTAKRQRIVRQIFGHLRLTYTASRVRAVFHEHRWSHKYEVLGADANSVAIHIFDTERPGGPYIRHIHFDGEDSYWIALGRNREWFKRVK